MNKGETKYRYVNNREYRDNIIISYKQNNFYNAYKLAIELLERTKDKNVSSSLDDKWACHLELSKICTKLGRLKLSLYYLRRSKLFAENESQYIRTVWREALHYKKLGYTSKTIELYDECIKFYINNNMMNYAADILQNKGYLLHNEDYIYQAIQIYKDIKSGLIQINNTDGIIIDIQQDLDNAYDSLFDIYIERGDILQAYKMIKLIQDKELKKQLRSKMQSPMASIL